MDYTKTYRGYCVAWDKESNSVSVWCRSGGRECWASAGLFEDSGTLYDGDDCWVIPSRETYEKLCELIEHVEQVGMEKSGEMLN
jgi:hypothetical protein